jgi:hypothetical protein
MADAMRIIYEDDWKSPVHVIFGDTLKINHDKISFPVDIPWGNCWFPPEEVFFNVPHEAYAKLLNYISKVPQTDANM